MPMNGDTWSALSKVPRRMAGPGCRDCWWGSITYARRSPHGGGPIRLLTHQLCAFGHCFNPASFYYCFDQHAQVGQLVEVEVGEE